MTTPAAARLYEAQHLYDMQNKRRAIYNPNNKPLEDLPLIMCFNNGGSDGWLSAVALAADGTFLGNHICSSEGYMAHDLGLLEGTSSDRHEEAYKPHYPDGYQMFWVPTDELKTFKPLNEAIRLNEFKKDEEKSNK